MMTFKIVINLTTGQDLLRPPCHYCLGSSLWITRNFSGVRFLASPIMAASVKIFLSLLSVSVLPPSRSSLSLKFSCPFLLPSFSHSTLPFPSNPMIPIFLGDLVYFPSQVYLYMFFLRFTLLFMFSGIVNYRLIILCFRASVHLWVSTYHAHLSGSGLPHSGCFFLVPTVCMQISRSHCFLLLSSIPLSRYTTFSLSIIRSRSNLNYF